MAGAQADTTAAVNFRVAITDSAGGDRTRKGALIYRARIVPDFMA